MNKRLSALFFTIALFTATSALAATVVTSYTTKNNDTIATTAAKLGETPAQFATFNPSAKLASGQTFSTTTITVTPPPVVPPVVTPPATGEIIIKNAYTTSYGYPDNTPGGTETHICVATTCAWDSAPAGTAGGDGTYANPITLAVGVSHIGGNEVDDYQAGTIFYDPNLRRYFKVGDICGDGNSPQNGACHKSEVAGTIQLDLWAGGSNANTTKASDPLTKCEDAITRTGTLIENPASNYLVVSGPVFNGTCAAQFGDVAVTQ